MESFATFLLDRKKIDQQTLKNAKSYAAKNQQNIAEVLVGMNYIKPFVLYKEFASYKKYGFADLRKEPCDKALLHKSMRDEYIKKSAMPWKKDGDITVIATSNLTNELHKWARHSYGNAYRFAITTPLDIHYSVNNIFVSENDIDAREELWKNHPYASAKTYVSASAVYITLLSFLVLIGLCFLFPVNATIIVCVVTCLLYALTLCAKLITFGIGYFAGKEAEKNSAIIDIEDSKLPIYTILVPLYHEAKTLPKLFAAIENLDYPKTKLDVKLIIESDDNITRDAIINLRPSPIFEIISVPYSVPRTKPKACNYALRFVRGEYTTIYDAEDIPEPEQLKKVLYKFASGDARLACVQARLNYFNRKENWLAKMFALEYSALFDFVLFGMEKLGMPILLGGTSNHFRTILLRKLYAWDPYNVTEDADLGMRIERSGLACAMVWSITKEESPLSVHSWVKQRTRWIKGHMQTYAVHMRNPMKLYKELGLVGFLGVQFFLGAPALVFLISPIMWMLCGVLFSRVLEGDSNIPIWFNVILDLSIFSLIFGAIIQIICAIISIYRNNWYDMLLYSLLFPFYWVLHSIASFRALKQIVTCPHYWEKTTHGVTSHNLT